MNSEITTNKGKFGKSIYLDNAATTEIDPVVLQEMIRFLQTTYGNPSSKHIVGDAAKFAFDKARGRVAKHIGVHPKEVIFTSGGTESNNLALKGIAFANKNEGNHIITSKIEHPSIIKTCESLEEHGFEITYLDVDKNGRVDPSTLEENIRNNTILVSIMHANNEIGSINDIEKLAKICKNHNVLFHTDATQSFGKVPISLCFDLMTISSHKIHGIKGAGALIVKRGTKINPIIDGGHQEFGIRSGTENLPAIIGFAKAVELILQTDYKPVEFLQNRLIEEFQLMENIKLNTPHTNNLPNIVNISFMGLNGQELMNKLSRRGICVSTGSACSQNIEDPSPVLTALHKTPAEISSCIRFSLSKHNTPEQIDHTINVVKEIVTNLREEK